MIARPLTDEQFTFVFKTRKLTSGWECYGTWNGCDLYMLAETEEDARIEMWQKLNNAGWIKNLPDKENQAP